MRELQEFFFGSLQLLREADIGGSVLEQLGQQFPASKQRLVADVSSLQTKQIECVVNQGDVLSDPVGLKKLKGGFPVFIKRCDLAIDDEVFDP
jgi:hypothetical protein